MSGKTRIFTTITVVSNVTGNLLLSMGLRHMGSLVGRLPVAYIQSLFHPLVAAGVALLIIWMISQMVLLSWADLSFIVPVTSIGYVLSAVVGRVFLHEQVSWARWGGVALIVGGVILVSRTQSSTSPARASTDKRELVCS